MSRTESVVPIEILCVPDCPLVGRVRDTLDRTLRRVELRVRVIERVGDHPSPTLLIDGRDVTGRPRASDDRASCRLDLPTEEQILAALRTVDVRHDTEVRREQRPATHATGSGPRARSRRGEEEMDEADFQRLLDGMLAEGGLAGRRRRLSPTALTLHQRVLRTFADTGAAPTPEVLRGWSARLGIEPVAALAEMIAVDLVQGDPAVLRVLGAYPFAAEPRGHHVDVEGGVGVEAYCALDAIGVAATLERAVTITSHDRRTGAELRVEVAPDRAGSEPPAVVVSMPPPTDRCDEQAGDCDCPAVNFYTSAESARADGLAHGQSLLILTLPQAHRFATAVFRGHLAPQGDGREGAPSRR